jgi:hypothetical protein
MPEKYRRRTIAEVSATQFVGGEDSAAAIIAWAKTIPDGPEIVRHRHEGSWNDEHRELWLKIDDQGNTLYAAPGCWIVIDGDDCDVLSQAVFDETYELAEATA